MAKTDQELAQEEINNRQYMYGGLGPFSQFLSGQRREIIRPESTKVVGFGAGPTGVEYITETIPAEYGPVEYDPSFSPARRGLSALGDILYEAPSFFGLRGPDEQVEAMQGVGSSLRDALFGSAEYMSEQARAAASGGEYFDPETGRTVAFDPTITMFGGNPAEGAVMGSGLRMGRRAAEDEYIRSINPEGVRIAPNDRPNLAMGDMYGMAPRNATEIMRQDLPSGGVVRYVQGDDGVYALGYNPDLGEEDVIGYMLGRGDGTELSVVNEMQGQGIGGNLSYLYRSQNPMAPSGGLTEAGEAAARSAYRRMLSDRSRPDFDMDTTYYHGTSSDFAEFTPSEVGDLGPGIYMTPNPEKASGYAAMRRFMRRDTNNASPNVMPLRLRKDLNFLDLQGRAIMPFDEDRIQRLRDSGYDGIRQLDESGNVTQLNIFDPENIRSVNAEFKPGESANILYSGGGKTGTGIAAASVGSAIAERMPPLSNAQRTQLGASTLPSYQKARNVLGEGRTLDFGAGRGQGAAEIGADTFEPYPREGFNPTYASAADIPDESYKNLTSLNVLNVMPRDVRDQAVADIGRVLAPGGRAVVTTRGRDVLNAKGTPGREPMSIITTADTYQKGFTQPELRDYMQAQLGEGFTISNLPEKIGQAGVLIEKTASPTALYSGGRTGTGIAAGSSLGQLLQEQFPKDYDPRVIESYTSAGIDPRTYAAGSGANTRKPLISQVDRNLSTDIQIGGQRIGDVPTINLEDYEGYPFISSMADRSAAGDVIQSINGVPVDVSRRGGLDYMFDPESGELVWASAPDVLVGQERRSGTSVFKEPREKSILGRAIALREQTGKDPLFIPFSMAPTGVDFSQPAEVMLSHARNALDLSDLNKLDADIKEVFPGFSGINSPDGINQVNQASGDVRKKIINIINNDYSQKGALTSGQARAALLDQAQAMSRDSTLRNVGLIDTSRMITVGDVHPIYKGGLYGEGLGRLADSYSVYELNPQAAYLGGIRPDQLLNPPRSTGMGAGTRKLELSPLTGVITEDVLRGMEARRAQL